MEELEDIKKRQRQIERIVLGIHGIYDIGMSAVAMKCGWESWIPIMLVVEWFVCLIVYVGRYRSYRFRVFFTAGMQQVGIVIYGMFASDIFSILPAFVSIIVFLGLYSSLDVLYLPAVSITFLICYHGIVLGTIQAAEPGDGLRMALQLCSVYFAEYIMYYLIKKQIEGNVRQQRTIEMLKEAERGKNDFLTNVSHEIRTPINTIYGMSEIVLREKLPQKVREDVLDIQTAGRNLLSVVSDILDFSELQDEKMEIVEEAYNITSTVNDAIQMSLARKSEKNIELIVDCHANIPCGLVGDEQKIRRVIMNLVNNAIKFTDEGFVSITITYRRTDYGLNLSVRVRDTGIGMKEESLEKLFTTFNQVDTKRNRQEGGIGLGLAISRAIIDKMGGFITVKSEYGKGSEIQFVIPQKIYDETPIISIREPDRLNVGVYIDMEQFDMTEIRDEYTRNIEHMVKQLNVKCHSCRNLAELKRWEEREHFTHIFISLVEYREDKKYFDELALQTKVVAVIDRPDERMLDNPHLLRLYKPFFVLPVAKILNDEKTVQGVDGTRQDHGRFIAPDVHVLIVDDNLINIKVLEGLLNPYQIKVTRAVSGQEALKKIDTRNYDFVFMDHMMPVMDGVETLHRIRQKPGDYFRKVPVIALTANAIGGMREMFLAEGFSDFVSKPVEISVLERVLKRNIPEDKLIRQKDNGYREAENETKAADAPLKFAIGDLDVQKGIAYCGDMENYLEVLRMHCQNGAETRGKLQRFYEQHDWKNYAIIVHALKGAMQGIGAAELSQMGKALEQAAREEDEGYILQNHEAMMAEYDRVLGMLRENEKIHEGDACREEMTELNDLSDTEFDQMLVELETAVYTLEERRILEVLNRLQQYSYHGTSLREPLEPVKKKIQMSDFMSAYEVVVRLKEKLKKQ